MKETEQVPLLLVVAGPAPIVPARIVYPGLGAGDGAGRGTPHRETLAHGPPRAHC